MTQEEQAIAEILGMIPAVHRIAGDRVYKGTSGQNEKQPYACYHWQGTSDFFYLLSGTPTRNARARFEVEAWAKDDTVSAELGQAIRDAFLDFHRGWAGPVKVTGMRVENTDHSEQQDAYGSDRPWWYYSIEVAMRFEV